LDEVIHNWNILTNIVEKHGDFFIKLYKDFSNDKISEKDLKEDKIFEFILKNTDEFN